MSTSAVQTTCRRWMIEYECWRTWHKFSPPDPSSAADGVASRGSLRHPTSSDADRENDAGHNSAGCRLLVTFMCKLMDATSQAACDSVGDETRNVAGPTETTLEQAIEVFGQMFEHFREAVDLAEWRHVKLTLRRHAVLLPIRHGDRTTAKAVFGRQWRHWKSPSELAARDELALLVDRPTSSAEIPDIGEMMTASRCLLASIMATVPEPFIVRVAQSVFHQLKRAGNSDVVAQRPPTSVAVSVRPAPTLDSAAQNTVPPATSSAKTHAAVVVLEKIREKDLPKGPDRDVGASDSRARTSSGSAAALHSSPRTSAALGVGDSVQHRTSPRPAYQHDRPDSDSSNSLVLSPLRKTLRPATAKNYPPKRQQAVAAESLQRHKNVPARTASECTAELDTELSDDGSVYMPDDVSCDSVDGDGEWNAKTSHAKKSRHTKKRWSSVEEELLYKGVLDHGVGNWAPIQANFLRTRTNVNIKDKWRTLKTRQTDRLQELTRQFGPLPGAGECPR